MCFYHWICQKWNLKSIILFLWSNLDWRIYMLIFLNRDRFLRLFLCHLYLWWVKWLNNKLIISHWWQLYSFNFLILLLWIILCFVLRNLRNLLFFLFLFNVILRNYQLLSLLKLFKINFDQMFFHLVISEIFSTATRTMILTIRACSATNLMPE